MPPAKSDGDYQAEDDHRTLQRAAEVQGDPLRMQRVRRVHRKQTRALKRVGASLQRSAPKR